MRLDLIITMRDTYINSNLDPLTKFSSSSRSTKFKDKFFFLSQVITKTILISKRIIRKKGYPFLHAVGKTMESDKNMIRFSQWKENHCRTNTKI